METQWGTSYNSYLIKDELGDVIVDTVHNVFVILSLIKLMKLAWSTLIDIKLFI